MVLTKELILSVLERNSKQFKINGFTLTILDKVDWGKAAKEILEVQNFSSEEQPQLNKHDVSGWQDFKDMQPNECEKVVLKDTDGYLLIATHRAEYMDSMLRIGYSWCRLPACH